MLVIALWWMIAGGGGSKNPVDCFLPGCRDQCIAEHRTGASLSSAILAGDEAYIGVDCNTAILAGDEAYIGVHCRRMLIADACCPPSGIRHPPSSPKLESIGRPRRPPPLYILMSSISSHWTIPPPLTLCTFISAPIWPPQEGKTLIQKEHCILQTHSLGPAVRLEQDLVGILLCLFLAPCLVSCSACR